MKETGGAGKKKSGSKAILYAVLGVIFLFVLAFTSSIDVSFVYVFTGISTLFFFLAANDWLRHNRREPGTGNYNRDDSRRAEPPPPKETPADILYRQEVPAQAKQQSNVSQKPPPAPVTKSKLPLVGCIAILIVGSFFGIIAIIVFTAIFGGDSDFDKIYYTETARNYFDSNQYDSAAANYRRALRLDPTNEDAQIGYGKVLLYGLQQYDSALIMFNKALEINPDNRDAAQHRGLSYYYLKNYEAAIQQAFTILGSDSTYVPSMLLAGDCYYDQQRHDETLKWYLKAYSLGERQRNLAWNIAYIYDIKGNTRSAIPFYKETLEYDTTLVDIYKRLGELIPGEDGDYYRTMDYQLRQNK